MGGQDSPADWLSVLRSPVVRIGVSGHRDIDAKHVEDVRKRIRDVFGAILAVMGAVVDTRDGAALARDVKPRMRVISPLAAGADSLVAEVGVEEFGAELQCPFPSPVEDYQTSFDAAQMDLFDRLRGKATAVFSLDGSVNKATTERSRRQLSYRRVGSVVAQNCDVLIAILDPDHGHAPGGTADIVEEALELDQMIAWIDPVRAAGWGRWAGLKPAQFRAILRRPVGERAEDLLSFRTSAEEFKGALARSIATSQADAMQGDGHGRPPDLSSALLSDLAKPPGIVSRGFGGIWSACIWKERRRKKGERDEGGAAAQEGTGGSGESRDGGSEGTRGRERVRQIIGRFERYRRPVAALSRHYSGLYHSAFLVISALGVLAVGFGLMAWVKVDLTVVRDAEHNEAGLRGAWWYVVDHRWSLAELLVMISMVVIYWLQRQLKWHQKSIDYRLLAERLRHMESLALLARAPRLFPYLPAQYGQISPQESWVEQWARAIAREIGFAPGDPREPRNFDADYLMACRAHLKDKWLSSQLAYHRLNGRRAERMHRVVETLVWASLAGTIGACLGHLLGIESLSLNFLAAFLPALGAACHSVASQAEVTRLAVRSRAMVRSLGAQIAEMERLPADCGSAEMARIAMSGAEAMLGEVGEWRVLLQLHPPQQP